MKEAVEGMYLPLEEAILYVLNPIERTASTDREGSFSFVGLPGPLEYEVRVTDPDRVRRFVDAVAVGN